MHMYMYIYIHIHILIYLCIGRCTCRWRHPHILPTHTHVPRSFQLRWFHPQQPSSHAGWKIEHIQNHQAVSFCGRLPTSCCYKLKASISFIYIYISPGYLWVVLPGCLVVTPPFLCGHTYLYIMPCACVKKKVYHQYMAILDPWKLVMNCGI